MYWKFIATVFVPIIFLFVAFMWNDKKGKALCICLLMTINWVLELLPLPITALMPIGFFPLLGIVSTNHMCRSYMQETIMFCFSILAMAVAFEDCNLHKRIALKVILTLGTSIKLLMFGFMVVTTLLSMWITNSAATTLMVSVADVTIRTLQETHSQHLRHLELSEQPSSKHPKSSEKRKSTKSRTYNLRVNQQDEYDDEGEDNKIEDTDITENHNEKNLTENYEVVKNPENESSSTSSQIHLYTGDSRQLSLNHQSITSTIHNDTFSPNRRKTRKNKKIKKRKSKHPVIQKNKDEFTSIKLAIYLSIAYSANIGGTGTLIGTATNILAKGMIETRYPESNEITFATWFLYNVPNVLICTTLAWVYLTFVFIKNTRKVISDRVVLERTIKQHYNELGDITFNEVVIFACYILLILIWLLREPIFIKGWIFLFDPKIVVRNASPGIMIILLLCVIPAKPKLEKNPQLLKWETIKNNLSWEVLFIIGGGIAIADGIKDSGLSVWIGRQLSILKGFPTAGLIFILCMMASLLTEIFSNIATADLLIPIVNELSLAMKVNPLYFILPTTLCCSYSFMLPTGTPANAIVFHAAKMRLKEMIVPGFVMNILCCLVQLLTITTTGAVMFSLRTFPSWALNANNDTISERECD